LSILPRTTRFERGHIKPNLAGLVNLLSVP